MTSIPKNGSALGIFLLILLTSGQQSRGFSGSLHLADFARDMHRMADMLDQVSGVSRYGLSRGGSHSGSRTGGAVQTLSAPSLPDMQQLMEMAGPLMAMLGNGTAQK